jgi:hypothetical protein
MGDEHVVDRLKHASRVANQRPLQDESGSPDRASNESLT